MVWGGGVGCPSSPFFPGAPPSHTETLWTQMCRVFLEMSSCRHTRLHFRSLVIELSLCSHSPLGISGLRVKVVTIESWLTPSGDQPQHEALWGLTTPLTHNKAHHWGAPRSFRSLGKGTGNNTYFSLYHNSLGGAVCHKGIRNGPSLTRWHLSRYWKKVKD